MIKKLIESFLRSISRQTGSTLTRKALNHGDTRWECECCGAIKPKVAAKFYTMDGVVCRKCSKGV